MEDMVLVALELDNIVLFYEIKHTNWAIDAVDIISYFRPLLNKLFVFFESLFQCFDVFSALSLD